MTIERSAGSRRRKTSPLLTGNEGYNIIELMVVMAILAVISAIVIPNFLEARDRATWAVAVSNLRAVQSSLAFYHVRTQDGRYPGQTAANYKQLRNLLVDASLPEAAHEAGWKPAPVRYQPSPDRQRYTVNIRVGLKKGVPLTLTPEGIDPPDFPY